MTASDHALLDRTAYEMLEMLARKEISPVELAEASLDRIEALDQETNAFCRLDREATMAAARASEQRQGTRQPKGLIDGLPVAIKDAFDVRDWVTRSGSRLTSDSPSKDDAPTVAACRRNGFVPIGKTTCPEFGWKAVTDSPLTGVTRNPWDRSKTPGGSSGGSAVAVALQMAPLAIAADSGGSTRIPASFCGMVGFKPTHGRAPMHPGTHYGKLSQPGPIGRTVRDVAILLDVMSEQDPRDQRLGGTDRRYREEIHADLRPVRIAFSPKLGLDVEVDREVADAVRFAAHMFESLGARVVEEDPDVRDLREAFQRLFFGQCAFLARDWGETERDKLDPGQRQVIVQYENMSAISHMEAEHERQGLLQRMSRFHRDYDLLITPTVAIPPFEAGREVPEGWPHPRWTTWAPFTWPFNMTGQPAVSVPCGFTKGGLPIGLQIVGPRHADHEVLRAAMTYQQGHPLTDHRPNLLG